MNKKVWTRIWAAGLILNGLLTVALSIDKIAGPGFPDVVIRIIGAVQLAALVLLVFGFVRLEIWKFGRK